MSWIQTYSNHKFNPLAPDLEMICIEDIAHALSNLCRFTGHTREFYSVAEHSVHVSKLLPEPFKLWGLLHDASEAYLCDIARPVKYQPQLAGYLEVEAALMAFICKRFGLSEAMPAEVKAMDDAILQREALQLMGSVAKEWVNEEFAPELTLPCWSPKEAKQEFLLQYFQLTYNQESITNVLAPLSYTEAVAMWKGDQ